MTRSVFYGVGAFVGSITGPTTCAFWPDDPNRLGWDANQLVPVDLAKNPEAVRRGAIQAGDVQVDDFTKMGGMTSIGPVFPGGATLGLCYLEESRCAALGANDPRTTGPGRPYEWCTVVYHDGLMAGRRFHGFHATIIRNQGNLALVSLWARGTSLVANQPPRGTYWIDFDAFAHPVEPNLTAIGVGVAALKTGALFLDHRASSGGGGVIPFDDPKSPRWFGGAVAPRRRP